MKVLVIGGTGYIGSGLVERLRSAGHTPVLLKRTQPRVSTVDSEVRRGDLNKPETLSAAVTHDIDAVAHVATPTGDWKVDEVAIRTLLAALGGTGKPFVYTSGVWVLGSTGDGAADENTPTRPIEVVSGRPALEGIVLNAENVRGVVVRPGIAHGRGGGIPALMVDWAKDNGAGTYAGDAAVRWPMVHVDDLAALLLLAAERAPRGAVLHGVAEPGVRVDTLARAAAAAAGVAEQTRPWAFEDAKAALGAPFAEALALDQVVMAPASQALGWVPTLPDAVSDLRSGSYTAGSVVRQGKATDPA